jgi:hypothetical protein
MIQDDFKVQGWISLHRKLLHWKWYKIEHMTKLFIHLMLRANRLRGESRGIIIKPGQFATSLNELSKDTGISVRSIRTCLKRMSVTKEIDMEATNLGRIITVRNFLKYQQLESGVDYNNEESDRYATNESTKKATNESTNENNSEMPIETVEMEKLNVKATNETTKKATKKTTPNNNIDKSNNINPALKKNERNIRSDDSAKKSDFIERIIDQFLVCYRNFHGHDYIITNKFKERGAAAKLLTIFKQKYPDANTEKMLIEINAFLNQAIGINDHWLRNNMNLFIINSKYNQIINILKNGNPKSKNSDKGFENDPATPGSAIGFNVTDWSR